MENLIGLLSYILRTKFEDDQIRAEIKHINNWNDFYNLCEHNRVSPWIYKNLLKLDLTHFLPMVIQNQFIKSCQTIEERNKLRLENAKIFLTKFTESNIDVVILKGIGFAETIYGDPFYKRMNDVDILIKKNDLNKIWPIYEELKYFSMGELLGKSPRQYEDFSHHLPPYFSRDLNLMIGTHWELVTPMRGYQINYENLWKRVQPLNFYGIKLLQLSALDNLHHLCIHLSSYKAGVREVMDIYNLIKFYEGKIEPRDFIKEVTDSGTINPVFYALSITNILRPSDFSKTILENLRPLTSNKIKNKVKNNLYSINVILRSRSIQVTRVDKAFSSFKITKKPTEKLKFYIQMWSHILFPPKDEISRLNHWEDMGALKSVWGRIISPFKIMGSLCEDLGTKIFFLLMGYTFYKTIMSFIEYPFKDQKQKLDISYFAKEMGISEIDLNNLKERLE